ncbi:hypothetical protein [Pseudodesulfovibrio portus]|uniref:Uncharacterized protein n=1 Tax=Pseudodesulfovibrio portus TaxID=231439 RepID=A0ABN6RRL3_9BACT|nr:hypothetical protein [Pseudodesulfovibrio portus]BDQ33594.1 hypothetical protein JCM14722_11360 [Pseudodesulfovibrio portus]
MQVGAITTTKSIGRYHDKLEYSMPFYGYSRTDTPGMVEAVREVWGLLERDLGKRNRKDYREHVAKLLVALFVAFSTRGNPFLAIPLGKRQYEKGGRMRDLYLNYAPMKWAVEQMHKADLIEVHRGIHFDNLSRTTRARATPDLVHVFLKHRFNLRSFCMVDRDPIELRGEKDGKSKGESINITRGPLAQQANKMRERVNRINAFILKHDLRLVIDEEKFIEHYVRVAAGKKKTCTPPNPLAVKLHRVFNVTFEFGGRFYGTWIQNIPSELRAYVTINGVPVQEVDYKGLHPTMLYIEEGAPMVGDPYLIPGYGQPYRDLIKVFFLIMFNAESDTKAVEGIRGEVHGNPELLRRYHECMTDDFLYQALDDISRHHAPIAHHIASGVGKRLQRLDSEMMEMVMLDLMRKGILAIPIHDSLLVQNIHEHELVMTMSEASVAITGQAIPTEIKYPGNSPFAFVTHRTYSQ